MRFAVITLFPDLITDYARHGLLSRAVTQSHIEIETVQLREFAINRHGQVDDSPYGGGSGMVLRPEPAVAAIEQARSRFPEHKTVLLSPRGTPFTQEIARKLVSENNRPGGGLTFLSPRYEGVDARVSAHVDYELSLGDFILMGGELAALSMIEAITRLLPGVLGNDDSIDEESFQHGLLEYPQYTKPQDFRGSLVPEQLLSGNHETIRRFRREQSFDTTAKRRIDLIPGGLPPAAELNVALIHYPVVNKEGNIVTSSITNLDLHDIARSARTFGISRFYVIHPTKALRRLAAKILDHWDQGAGRSYNPNRSEALERIALVPDFDDALNDIEMRTGQFPRLVTTSARNDASVLSFAKLRSKIMTDAVPHLLMFGTGWGLADEIMAKADYRLEPIVGVGDYNHLSVRSAAAIILSRLLG